MKKGFFVSLMTLGCLYLRAQEDVSNIDVDIRTHDNRWYASPWVWIIGAAIFILLLVVLTRGKRE